MIAILSTLKGLCDLIPSWIYAIVVAFLMATGAWSSHELTVAKQDTENVKAGFANQMAALAKAHDEAETKSRTTEVALQAELDRTNTEHQNEIKTIAARADALDQQLRDRPARPAARPSSVVPPPAAPGANGSKPAVGVAAGPDGGLPGGSVVGTGAGLYREDSQWLGAYAKKSAVIQAALKTCEKMYAAAELALNK